MLLPDLNFMVPDGSNLVILLLIIFCNWIQTSIERREVSRRLEEEAMSYFEECVSISNFDGSDISSLEDPLPSSTACMQKLESDVFLSNEDIAFAESLISNKYEVSTALPK